MSVQNSEHNHSPTTEFLHSVLRKVNAEVKTTIAEQTVTSINPEQIISALQGQNSDLSLIKRDIYNTKTSIRQNALNFLTSIQVLMLKLDENYISAHTKDKQN